jgi:hypothetical protein
MLLLLEPLCQPDICSLAMLGRGSESQHTIRRAEVAMSHTTRKVNSQYPNVPYGSAMMFGRLHMLNTFSTYDIFHL